MSAGAVATGVSLGATALKLRGQVIEEEALNEADLELSLSKDRQADEILERAEINKRIVRRQAKETVAQQRTGLAAAGVDVGGELTLSHLQDTMDLLFDELSNISRESRFTAEQQRLEASLIRRRIDTREKAGKIGRLGTILTGLAGTAQAAPGIQGSKTTDVTSTTKSRLGQSRSSDRIGGGQARRGVQ